MGAGVRLKLSFVELQDEFSTDRGIGNSLKHMVLQRGCWIVPAVASSIKDVFPGLFYGGATPCHAARLDCCKV
jgi:hypothetical protein